MTNENVRAIQVSQFMTHILIRVTVGNRSPIFLPFFSNTWQKLDLWSLTINATWEFESLRMNLKCFHKWECATLNLKVTTHLKQKRTSIAHFLALSSRQLHFMWPTFSISHIYHNVLAFNCSNHLNKFQAIFDDDSSFVDFDVHYIRHKLKIYAKFVQIFKQYNFKLRFR